MRYPRAVRLSASRRLVAIAALLGVSASAAGFTLGAWWLVTAIVVVAVSGVARVVCVQAGLHGRVLHLSDDGTYRWDIPSSGHVLVSGTTDLGWAMCLRAAHGGASSDGMHGERSLMLLSDQMSVDDWRALSIWIRHKVRPPTEEVSEGREPLSDE